MAVRGLGNPVAFRLTAGHRGDVPQAAALIASLPAAVVLADGAYDAVHFRNVIAVTWALPPSSPTRPSAPANTPSTDSAAGERLLVECCFSKLSSSAASPLASRKPHATISPWSPSPPTS